jgi:hypothetical protein
VGAPAHSRRNGELALLYTHNTDGAFIFREHF